MPGVENVEEHVLRNERLLGYEKLTQAEHSLLMYGKLEARQVEIVKKRGRDLLGGKQLRQFALE
ncbi:hypothetical protein EBR25_13285 [bacterium]|nr:hypothetical protein [bacterium]